MDKTEQATAILKSRLKDKNIAGGYLLYGAEGYITDFYRRQLYSAALSLGGSYDCLRVREGMPNAAAQIISALETPSFGGGIKYIEVAGELLTALNARDKKPMAEEFSRGIPPETCLVVYFDSNFELTATAKKDAILSVLMADKNVLTAEFDKLTEANLTKWTGQIARAKKAAITPEAAKLLGSYCGGDMFRIESELEKLSYLGREIGAEDIAANVAKALELETFELSNAVIEANYGAALAAIEKMKRQKEDVTAIIGAFTSAFTGMLAVWQLNRDGKTADAIAKSTGLHPYRVKLYLSAANRLGADFLRQALVMLAQSDVRTKKSRLDGYAIVGQIVSRLQSIR